jgi:ArsR family transcriptional regulator
MKIATDQDFLLDASETLRAIAHPIRLSILQILHERKSLSVTEIYEALDIEQAVASHHLRIMKNKDVVSVKREGKNSLYSLRDNAFYRIFETMCEVRDNQ